MATMGYKSRSYLTQHVLKPRKKLVSFSCVFDGHRFYLRSDGYYMRRTLRVVAGVKVRVKIYLHVAIWEFFNGPRPDGYDIHHKDMNKQNNLPENLKCLEHWEHTSVHNKEGHGISWGPLLLPEAAIIRAHRTDEIPF